MLLESGHPHRVRERLLHVGYAIAVVVGDGEVAGVVDFERRRILAFAALFFRLQRVELPVGYILQLDSARTWCSLESSYTKPGMLVFETRMPAWAKVSGVQILAKVPPPPSIQRLGYCESQGRCGLGSAVGGVVGIHAGAVEGVGAVAAQKADIVYQRVFAGVPEKTDGPRVEAAGKNAEAR
jgi:hypothetical protein